MTLHAFRQSKRQSLLVPLSPDEASESDEADQGDDDAEYQAPHDRDDDADDYEDATEADSADDAPTPTTINCHLRVPPSSLYAAASLLCLLLLLGPPALPSRFSRGSSEWLRVPASGMPRLSAYRKDHCCERRENRLLLYPATW
jgi:hypothetical protein